MHVQVGQALRRCRTARGLSQSQLAALAESDRAGVSDLERGTSNPTLAVLLRFSGALSVPFSQIARLAENPRREPDAIPDRRQESAKVASFGYAIRSIRRSRHLTQKQLAARVGADRAFVSAIERGVRNPTLGSVIRLAAALDVSLSTIAAEAERVRDSSDGRKRRMPEATPNATT